MAPSSIVYGWESGLLLTLMGSRNPSDAEFQTYAQYASEKFTSGSTTGSLVLTEGAAPSARQRAIMVESVRGSPLPPTAILSNSTVLRGVATALSWMRSDAAINVFKPHELEGALIYLQVPTHQHPIIHTTLAHLASRFGREYRAWAG